MPVYKFREGDSERKVEIEEESSLGAIILHLFLFCLCLGSLAAIPKLIDSQLKAFLPKSVVEISVGLVLFLLIPLLLSTLYRRLLLAESIFARLYYHYTASYGFLAGMWFLPGRAGRPDIELMAMLGGLVAVAMFVWAVYCLRKREAQRMARESAKRERQRELDREEQIRIQTEAILRAEALKEKAS